MASMTQDIESETTDIEKERLFEILNNIDQAVIVSNPETHEILFANEYSGQVLNGSLVGSKCFRSVFNIDKPCMNCALHHNGNSCGKTLHNEFYHTGLNRHFRTEDKVIEWFDGRRVNLKIANDITGIKQYEAEYRKLMRAVEHSPASIVITDLKGDIEYVNPKFTELTGYPAESVLGQNPRVLKGSELTDQDYKNMWEEISAGRTWHGIFHNKKRNGEFFWEAASISPVLNAEGVITHYIAIKEDITEKKLALEELEKAEQQLKYMNAAKDKLFSIIAEDLKGPFSGFFGLTQLLAEEHHRLTMDDVAGISGSLKKAASNFYNLLENLLEWSKSQMNNIEVQTADIDLFDTVERTFYLFREKAGQKNIRLVNNVKKCTLALADNNMVNTVFSNLLSNALKYTPRWGTVIIESEDMPMDFVKITVTDTGIGMDDQAISKVFRIDRRLCTKGLDNETGTGLGLILCKEYVAKNGGSITLESRPDEGTRVTFTLPAKA